MTDKEKEEDRFVVDELTGDEDFIKAREQVRKNCERLKEADRSK